MPQPPNLLGPLLTEFETRLNAREHHVALLLSRYQGLMIGKGATRRVRRLGFPLFGVGMPGHFLLKHYDIDGSETIIDCFNGGDILSAQD